MNVNSWLKKAKQQVPALDAELILLAVLGLTDRTRLVLDGEQSLSLEQAETAGTWLKRRAQGEPLAYILGKKEFYGRELMVTSATLIPRPETEDIIGLVLANKAAIVPGSVILDVGTGSGCIGITLALELPGAKVVGLDVSEEALRVARRNAERLGAEVKFERSDLLKAYDGDCPEILVANLPYVDREWGWLSPGLTYEPEVALYAEQKGLALIFRLLDEIKQKWYNEKDKTIKIFLEADPSQHEMIQKYAEEQGFRHILTSNFVVVLEI